MAAHCVRCQGAVPNCSALRPVHCVEELLSLDQVFARRGTQLSNPCDQLPSSQDIEATDCREKNDGLRNGV